MTAEMFRSDEPCAIARTFTPALPSAPKNVAATPGALRHLVADGGEHAARRHELDLLDVARADLRVERALGGRARELALRLGHREADRVLRARLRDEHDAHADVAKRAEQSLRDARHADHAGAFDVHERDAVERREALDDALAGLAAPRRCAMPGCDALNVLRIQIGMSRATAGSIVRGCSTLAPKYASSMASSYDISSTTTASGTRRGSALSTPSTSVQMMTADASSSAPKIDAGEVAAVALERRRHAVGRRRDVARDDDARRRPRARRATPCMRAVEVSKSTDRPELRGPHDEHHARVEPLGRDARALQVRREHLRRPDLAVPRDELARELRAGFPEPHGAQHVADVAPVGFEHLREPIGLRRRHERARRLDVLRRAATRASPCKPRRVCPRDRRARGARR